MFGKFKHFVAPKWRPLCCTPGDIIAMFREYISINAPMARLIVKHKGMRHKLGMDADYDKGKWFDIQFYIDNERFSSLEDFTAKATIDGDLFMKLDVIDVLEDEDAGDPRNNALLSRIDN